MASRSSSSGTRSSTSRATSVRAGGSEDQRAAARCHAALATQRRATAMTSDACPKRRSARRPRCHSVMPASAEQAERSAARATRRRRQRARIAASSVTMSDGRSITGPHHSRPTRLPRPGREHQHQAVSPEVLLALSATAAAASAATGRRAARATGTPGVCRAGSDLARIDVDRHRLRARSMSRDATTPAGRSATRRLAATSASARRDSAPSPAERHERRVQQPSRSTGSTGQTQTRGRAAHHRRSASAGSPSVNRASTRLGRAAVERQPRVKRTSRATRRACRRSGAPGDASVHASSGRCGGGPDRARPAGNTRRASPASRRPRRHEQPAARRTTSPPPPRARNRGRPCRSAPHLRVRRSPGPAGARGLARHDRERVAFHCSARRR